MPCFTSLAHAEKNSSALQGRWREEPEGFTTHVSFRKGNKRVVTTPQGKQNGIMAAARRTEGGCIKTCEKELLRLVGELAQRA